MDQYNVLQAIYMSFYSKKLYRDVAMRWGGKAFLYLFMLVIFIWILPISAMQDALNKNYAQYSILYVQQIPVVKIEKGSIKTPDNKPYFVKNPDTKETIMVIDTTGKYTDLKQTDAKILVTKSELISQARRGETRIMQLPDTLTMTVDPWVVNKYIQNSLSYVWIFAFIFLVLISYIYHIFQALVYGLVGKIFNFVVKSPMSYIQMVQVALVAITPPLLIATILESFVIIFPYQALFYFLLAMFYLFYGISANKES